jgi:hypothetical protein
LHGDIEVRVGAAEQVETDVIVATNVEQQLIAFAPLGDLQPIQQRLVRGAGAACQGQAFDTVAARQVQVLVVHPDLNSTNPGQVELEIARRLVFA